MIVKNRRIVATGYNGARSGEPSCLEKGCIKNMEIDNGHCQRVLHSEMNAVGYAAKDGIALYQAFSFTFFRRGKSQSYHTRELHNKLDDFPCHKCGQVLITAGIVGNISCEFDGTDYKLASYGIEQFSYPEATGYDRLLLQIIKER